MSPTDKLELIRVLDVSNVITQLLNADDERKGSGNHSEQEELYREKLARNLNGLGLELTRIIDEVSDARLRLQVIDIGCLLKSDQRLVRRHR